MNVTCTSCNRLVLPSRGRRQNMQLQMANVVYEAAGSVLAVSQRCWLADMAPRTQFIIGHAHMAWCSSAALSHHNFTAEVTTHRMTPSLTKHPQSRVLHACMLAELSGQHTTYSA